MLNATKTIRYLILAGITALAVSPVTSANETTAKEVVPGLWEYTGLITSSGVDMPLTGIFLFADGTFVQQAIFDGEPFSEQGSMAHSGPYTGSDAGIALIAKQTLSIDPSSDEPLTSMGITTHDLTVERDGNEMTLVFGAGTGTIQTLTLVSDAESVAMYTLENGTLAFTGTHFLLVNGDESSALSGYGTYVQAGDDYSLMVTRWSESDGDRAENLKDTEMSFTFDGSQLTLDDGRQIAVID
jgi:hypothetical protein